MAGASDRVASTLDLLKTKKQFSMMASMMRGVRTQVRDSWNRALRLHSLLARIEGLATDDAPELGEAYRLTDEAIRIYTHDLGAIANQKFIQCRLEEILALMPKNARSKARAMLDSRDVYMEDFQLHVMWCKPLVWTAIDTLAGVTRRTPPTETVGVLRQILFMVPFLQDEELREHLTRAFGSPVPLASQAEIQPLSHHPAADSEDIMPLSHHPAAPPVRCMSAGRCAPGVGGTPLLPLRRR
jgi:hypothetical protein